MDPAVFIFYKLPPQAVLVSLTLFFSSLSLSKVSLSTSLTTVGSPEKQVVHEGTEAWCPSVMVASGPTPGPRPWLFPNNRAVPLHGPARTVGAPCHESPETVERSPPS